LSAIDDAYAHCEALCREHERDLWLASLFAPAAARPHLNALNAFSYEVSRIRDVVRSPIAGQMRLAWWREAIEGERDGEAAANPVAAALLETIGRFNLPRKAFVDLLAAREFDLFDDPMPTLNDLAGYCGETSSLPIRLAMLILGEGRDLGGAEAAGHAGVAVAITALLRALPRHASRGQVYLPLDVLARHGLTAADVIARGEGVGAALAELRAYARERLRDAMAAPQAPELRPALLPLAVVPLYLAAMDRPTYQPFETLVAVPQWRRQWALWRAARAG
jgi:phytoene synthase